jgi:tRNA pseudouridine55 synthase
MLSGIVLIDKAPGMTSHDVVAKLRKQLSEKKIGHAGTLDPFATGLLIMGVGSGTKLLHHLFGLDKQYHATFRLGQSTSTDDLEGAVLTEDSASAISQQEIQQAIRNLTGTIEQVPSSVSAIKIAGKRAYEIARSGQEVSIPARTVNVYHFEMTSPISQVGEWLEFEAVIDCSSGTYIRALARDLGVALGTGGHLRALRRTRIGELSVRDASDVSNPGEVIELLEIARKVYNEIELSPSQAQDVVHGKRVVLESEETVAASSNGKLLAILEPAGKSHRSITVFPEALNV